MPAGCPDPRSRPPDRDRLQSGPCDLPRSGPLTGRPPPGWTAMCWCRWPPPTSVRCWLSGGRPRRRGTGRRHAGPGQRGQLRPARAAAVQGAVRRAELPGAHPGDRPGAAAVPDAVRQVRPDPAGQPRRPGAALGERPGRLGGRAGRGHRPADLPGQPGRGGGGHRRIHRHQRREHARLAEPHPAVAAGQDVRGGAPRSARTWSPGTRSATPRTWRSAARWTGP